MKKMQFIAKSAFFLMQNRMCDLFGMEVDETYKGVVIKNGQKFIQ